MPSKYEVVDVNLSKIYTGLVTMNNQVGGRMLNSPCGETLVLYAVFKCKCFMHSDAMLKTPYCEQMIMCEHSEHITQ